jgi:hypothetical protein
MNRRRHETVHVIRRVETSVRHPRRRASFASEVLAPAVTAGLVTTIGATATIMFLGGRWTVALLLALAFGALAAAVILATTLPGYQQRLGQLETRTIEEVPLRPGVHFVQTAPGHHLRLPDEPAAGTHARFAADVLRDASAFSESGSRRHGYSRPQWEELRDWLLDAGLARWRDVTNHRLGAELTAAGRAAFRRIMEAPDELG